MTARDAIAERLGSVANPHYHRADFLLRALETAGYRILAPGEFDPATVERCISICDHAIEHYKGPVAAKIRREIAVLQGRSLPNTPPVSGEGGER